MIAVAITAGIRKDAFNVVKTAAIAGQNRQPTAVHIKTHMLVRKMP